MPNCFPDIQAIALGGWVLGDLTVLIGWVVGGETGGYALLVLSY